ncbi:type IV pilus secretin PilQ [Halomonas sp. MCCC 1A17488]|uniref:type IV pilus secretin PilQ n=1 Tax=unclassified Halomonas TaxID=2609666 RepID=UPI0018D2309B|nr:MULTISPECIES: type IV pilus secretin PilQ [unclassified Halomonas]MCE8016700.1 type IV pilus secretin PilQ [Halomonas sp. MCCC 1A17488]MCG3240033.1 type IV pilus secretin PilQ [Halomonas sp. MCCC 1A17488]QPP50082.1 type IV pilus secretin PilQ [Halomonas sp. SS10-MC5]
MRDVIRIVGGLCLALVAMPGLAATALTDLDFRQGEHGELLIDLSFSEGVPEVRGYRLDEPARLTLDLTDTTNALERRRIDLGIGGVEQVTALEAGSRTRLVFNMDGPLPYDTVQEGGRLRLVIGGRESASAAAAPSPEPAAASRPAAAVPSAMPTITDIDFRRGEEGAGRLIVTFDRAGIDARVREPGRNRIVAELSGVELPEAYNQALDVTDFGTPIQRITPRSGRDGVTLEIEGSGEFAMLSTQSGRQLTIEAQPVTRQEREQRVRQQFPYTGERITLNFQDIEVRSVLAIIADFTGLNLVASDSVTGEVTLNLQDVPWDQALDLVLKSHGLASRQEGNVIVVAPASELANIERQQLEARAQAETLAPLVSEYVQVKYARAEDLAQLLRGGEGFGLLSERGRVAVDARTNTLLIQDTADQIQEILATLEQLDVAVRQVQIEARIVIARDGVTQELGVNWGASGGGSRFNLGGASTGTPIAGFGDGLTGQRDGRGQFTGEFDDPTGSRFERGGLAVDLGSANPMTSFSFGYLSGDILLDLELRALESENKSQTISQPRVITANQRKATIIQGEERAFQSIGEGNVPQTEFKEAELSLEVTPQITPDNRIIMDLVVKNDSFREAAVGQAPPIDTNRIETQVLVDNGETVVLGGILTTEQLSRLAKTPFFGDLPVLGRLFRYNESSNQKVELLVFITPRILEDGLAIR